MFFLSKLINRYTTNFKSLPLVINKIKTNNLIPIIDYANENSNDFYQNYKIIYDTITKYPNNVFALKFSSLGLSNSLEQQNKPYILAKTLIDLANKNNSTIMIDAEQNDIQNKINLWTDDLITQYNKDRPIIYKTYQMYRKDTYDIFCNDLDTFKDYHLGIKLVRGAYYDTDKHSNVLFSNKIDTDNSYNDAIKYFNLKNNSKHKLVLASHNEESIQLIENLKNPTNNISVAHLLGFSDKLSNKLVNNNYIVYKYLPFGNYLDTLPYLIRRLYENYPMLLYLKK